MEREGTNSHPIRVDIIIKSPKSHAATSVYVKKEPSVSDLLNLANLVNDVACGHYKEAVSRSFLRRMMFKESPN